MKIWGKEQARAGLLHRLPLELYPLPPTVKAGIRRVFGHALSSEQVVARIIAQVKEEGDVALKRLTLAIDGVELKGLEVSSAQRKAALSQVPPELLSALTSAAERIEAFHRRLGIPSALPSFPGAGRQVRPLNRVGIYVPGGGASYPSTLLMAAIPARVAGVKEIHVATPPSRNGEIPPAVLAAAHLAKVNRVFIVGGAQAVAALAWGTSSIPKVDKICGPGNIFVQLAKKQLYGVVDIDGLYGPTELVVLADDSASPRLCAAELLAQAEHDSLATAILITPSLKLAQKVNKEIETQIAKLSRQEVIVQALEGRGGIVSVGDMKEAIELVNDYAPEHLCLMGREAEAWAGQITNAGCVSIGSPVAWADYMAGPGHILPTGGSARFASPLSIETFLKTTNIVTVNKETLARLGPAAVKIAQMEGLTAHALSLELWLKEIP